MTTPSSRSGAVLLLVLCVLVLLSVIAVAFLLSSSDHYLLANGSTRTTEARLLADSACQVAISQIQTATGVNTASTANPPLWYSQPGLIRTINSGTYTAYKLYSAPTMIVPASSAASAFNPVALSGGGDLPDVPQNWASDPVHYVDLNQPSSVSSGILTSTLLYPIVDPSVNTTPGPPSPATVPQGFWYTNNNSTSNADNVTNFKKTSNPLPMPVQWLYVMQDGTIQPLDAANKAAAASATNPIVGRIAFWTDDETCKININTAGGDEWSPQYFSKSTTTATDPICPIPAAGQSTLPPGPPNTANPTGPGSPIPGSFNSQTFTTSTYDYFCLFLPAVMNHEFQRYPGHPASTYLSAVFPTLNRQQLLQLAPRLGQWTTTQTTSAPVAGNTGSSGGTVPTLTATNPSGSGWMTQVNMPNVVPATTRLYESVDELQYAPVTAATNPNGTNQARFDLSTAPTTALQPILNAATIQPLRFFLTANSVAPELNVFGRPRVSIWPVSAQTSYWSAYDRLAAFCSTLGTSSKTPFFISRFYPSETSLTAPTIPSRDIAATFKPVGYAYGNADLFTYLQAMMSQTIPGHTQSLATKFGTDSNQILTEIFDYVRCTNLQDPNAVPSISPIYSLQGGVSPLRTKDSSGKIYQGFGREPILNRVAFIFWIMNPVGSPPTSFSLQCMFYPQFFNPMVGQVPCRPNLQIVVNNLDKISFTGSNSGSSTVASGFASTGTITLNPGHWSDPSLINESLGGTAMQAQIAPYYGGGAYPFLSSVIPLANIKSSWNTDVASVSAGTPSATATDGIKLKSSSNIIVVVTDLDTKYQQAYSIPLPANFNAGTTPFEVRLPGDKGSCTDLSHTTRFMDSNSNARIQGYPPGEYIFSSEDGGWGQAGAGRSDSAVAMEISDPNVSNTSALTHQLDADYRLISLIPSTGSATVSPVPVTDWQPHYLATGTLLSDTLAPYPALAFNAASFPLSPGVQGMPGNVDKSKSYIQYLFGSLLEYSNNSSGSNFPLIFENGNFNQGTYADFPSSLNSHDNSGTRGALLINSGNTYKGDWDSGFGLLADGAYVNKADEGGTAWPFGGENYNGPSPGLFNPNREVASPVTFGSLPTGYQRGQPWQTLLFCPNPASRTTVTDLVSTGTDTSHPGFADPPDHLILDLFNMPVVEPYAISQPFATAGKVNLNYQMVPFTYIHRDTALRAVLRSTMITAMPTQAAPSYKATGTTPMDPHNPSIVQDLGYHYQVDLDTTLSIFDKRFGANLPFQTASEICSMYLFPTGLGFSPTGTTPLDLQNWWNKGPYGANYNSATSYQMLNGDYQSFGSGNNPTGFQLTGDNLREQPYNQIYSRLTTQSNTYTVHVWAQTLKQVTSSTPGTWNNNADQVTGEYRGSYLVERYLSPNIPSYNMTTAPSLNNQYKMRIVASRIFAP